MKVLTINGKKYIIFKTEAGYSKTEYPMKGLADGKNVCKNPINIEKILLTPEQYDKLEEDYIAELE